MSLLINAMAAMLTALVCVGEIVVVYLANDQRPFYVPPNRSGPPVP